MENLVLCFLQLSKIKNIYSINMLNSFYFQFIKRTYNLLEAIQLNDKGRGKNEASLLYLLVF